MLEFLKAPEVQAVIGLIVAIAIIPTLLLAYTGPLWRKPKKELSFGFSMLSILEEPFHWKDKFEIKFFNSIVTRVDAVNVFFMNTGSVPIEKGDFVDLVRVRFHGSKELHGVNVKARRPTNLPVKVEGNDELVCVEIEPLLLNPGDYVAITVIVSGNRPSVELDSRITGISKFNPLLVGKNEVVGVNFIPVLLIAAAMFFSWMSMRSFSTSVFPFWLNLISALPGPTLFASAIYLWTKWGRIRSARWMGKGTEDLSYSYRKAR